MRLYTQHALCQCFGSTSKSHGAVRLLACAELLAFLPLMPLCHLSPIIYHLGGLPSYGKQKDALPSWTDSCRSSSSNSIMVATSERPLLSELV